MSTTAKIRYLKGRLRHWNWKVEQQELFLKHLKDKNVSYEQMMDSETDLYKMQGYRNDIQIALVDAETKAKEIPMQNGTFSEI